MTPELVTEIMCRIFQGERAVARNPYDENLMANAIIRDLAAQWHILPDSTKATMLGVAYDLKMQSTELREANHAARLVLDRAMQDSR